MTTVSELRGAASVDPASDHEIDRVLNLQRRAYQSDRLPDAAARRRRLDALIAMLERHEDRLIAAIEQDFGARSKIETLFAEIVASVSSARLARNKVARWMRPRVVTTPLHMLPGKSRIIPQPLGVAGVISPWNYPVYLAMSPVASALAAGNRVMLKPSELTPATSATIAAMVRESFDESVFAVICGGADIGAAFANATFDHLLFTGSTSVGRKVALAAAANLTPVTLELGGKSPAILDPSANLAKATRSIVFGKAFNAGQTCVAPDYVIVPQELLGAATRCLAEAAQQFFPNIDATSDYSSVVSDTHFARLREMVREAKDAGAEVIEAGSPEVLGRQRKLPFTLVVNPPRACRLMREEIFGPVLPIISVGSREEAIALVNAGERPLALYWFGEDAAARQAVLTQTVSGGVTVNDTNWHVVQENLPFGGVGQSGSGVYHGQAGFETFSNMKSVFFQSRFANASLLQPPYTQRTEQILRWVRKII